ncbi:MAG TPA: ABC transporter substrate-binding protein [Woeseiaceae bacterium]|jgi:phospholipid transport system substrate-binding protein|nr:ABC transporter substrate-binding protein [Woeseiaceae bacterium]
MIRGFVLAVVLMTIGAVDVSAEDSPNAVIESSVVLLAEQLAGRREELAANREELYKIVDDILLPRFDSRFAAQVVLAKHWRTATEEQQTRFIEAFYRALLRKYSDGILEFDPDMVTVLPYRGDDTKKRTKVRSTVALEDGSKVAVDYDLVKRQSGWLVFNVVIEGVSYVRNFRAELDSEIRSSSLDAVIARLEGEAGINAAE